MLYNAYIFYQNVAKPYVITYNVETHYLTWIENYVLIQSINFLRRKFILLPCVALSLNDGQCWPSAWVSNRKWLIHFGANLLRIWASMLLRKLSLISLAKLSLYLNLLKESFLSLKTFLRDNFSLNKKHQLIHYT